MQKRIATFFLLLSLLLPSLLAETVPEGEWKQTASTAGSVDGLTVSITKKTPHIITLVANNGWVGYAYYDPKFGVYQGFLELVGTGGNSPTDWRNEVFLLTLKYDGLTLTLDATSPERSFKATYWAQSGMQMKKQTSMKSEMQTNMQSNMQTEMQNNMQMEIEGNN